MYRQALLICTRSLVGTKASAALSKVRCLKLQSREYDALPTLPAISIELDARESEIPPVGSDKVPAELEAGSQNLIGPDENYSPISTCIASSMYSPQCLRGSKGTFSVEGINVP